MHSSSLSLLSTSWRVRVPARSSPSCWNRTIPNSNFGIVVQSKHFILLISQSRGTVTASDFGSILMTTRAFFPITQRCYWYLQLSSSCISNDYVQFDMMKEEEKHHEQLQDNDLEMPLNHDNRFIQFIFRNTQISLAYKSTLACLAAGFLIFFTLSIAMLAVANSITTISVPYYEVDGSTCQVIGSVCSVKFNIPVPIYPPIYLSYQLSKFYQNQRLFTQSKSSEQLFGNNIDMSKARYCQPYTTNAEMNVNVSWGGVPLDPTALSSPCGAIAKFYFNDSFTLLQNGQYIFINETGISWPDDKGGVYRRTSNSSITQWIDPENEHFIVWMRTAGIPNFKKPWGIIQQQLPAGEYQMSINNNYGLQNWRGSKQFILSTLNRWGGENYLLPVSMLLVSFGCLAAGLYIARLVYVYRKLARNQ